MLSAVKFKKVCQERKITVDKLADQIVRGGLNKKQAVAAIKNWQKGLFKTEPGKDDISRLAVALSADVNDISNWQSSYRFAPGSARKARLVAVLIAGRSVQDALDVLKFTRKRAASMIDKVLKSAVADADEQQADVENLYVSEARIDDAGNRLGTKQWRAKDRGKAYSINKRACHIHVTVSQV